MGQNFELKREIDKLFEDDSLPLVVAVTQTSWDDPPRIRHQMTRQLTRFYNVIYININASNKSSNETITKIGKNLLILKLGTRFPVPSRLYANDPLTHHLVNKYYKRKISNLVTKFPCKNKILVNFVYDFWEIMKTGLFSYQLYVCFDEFPKMWRCANMPPKAKYFYQSKLFQYYENNVVRSANRCLATHTPLVNKLSSINPNTSLFLHGHEFSVSNAVRGKDNSVGSIIKIAYMGYISYRLIVSWLLKSIESPDIQLNLIGPVSKFDCEPFTKYANFVLVPPLTGRELQNKLSDMDVLIMPYDPKIPENYVQTVSNKFFQYIAAGKPVVISHMPHYISMPKGIIYRANTADIFVDKIRQAYKEDCPEFVQCRQNIASENTWDRRGDLLHSIIEHDTN